MTIEINCDAVSAAAKKKALETLAQLDSATLNKLAELSKSPKALETFKNPPALLKKFLGIK